MDMRGGPRAKENISASMRVLDMMKTPLTRQEKVLATNLVKSDMDGQNEGSIKGLRVTVYDVYTICNQTSCKPSYLGPPFVARLLPVC